MRFGTVLMFAICALFVLLIGGAIVEEAKKPPPCYKDKYVTVTNGLTGEKYEGMVWLPCNCQECGCYSPRGTDNLDCYFDEESMLVTVKFRDGRGVKLSGPNVSVVIR
jgi:hypothetical protein